jgi:hypothetical protein
LSQCLSDFLSDFFSKRTPPYGSVHVQVHQRRKSTWARILPEL